MTVNKRKKKTRLRGSNTHGWGSKKKHRGSGNRGGFGMAGTGKRADHKKTKIIKDYGNTYFGKRGFKRPQKFEDNLKIINIYELSKFTSNEIDLKKEGFDKLLGKGKLNKKLKIVVSFASKSAIEKVKEHDGEVILG